MAKTPLANDPNWGAYGNKPPSAPHKPTRIAPGGAVPPPAPTAANDPDRRRPGVTAPIKRERSSRVGTHLHGMEGLFAPGAEAPKLRLTAGKVVPSTRYRILRWLGEGGMGVVYEAEHIDIERKVALKILRFDLSQQPKMVQVFRDEARAASRLGSQHLVEIYDFGELPDGRLFFAMELLDGSDLVPSEEGEAMPANKLIAVLRQICKGLSVAHKAGVVHRDVKPENIIMATRPDGRPDAIKLVDFGISAMLAAGPGQNSGIAGTPHYMPPEQILGKPFDGRLDVYALGCTAYELLTGHPPFDAENVEQLLDKQLTEAAQSPSKQWPGLSIPPKLEAVIMRCLEKEPVDRFADMADLEAAICEAQISARIRTAWDDLPIPDLPDRARREKLIRDMPTPTAQAGRRSLLWPLVAGISSLAAVGLAAFLFFGIGPTEEDQNIVDQLTTEARDAAAVNRWVVPAPDEPEAPTVYQKVVELEDVEGGAEALADERAEELRNQFADTLFGEAKKLWDAGAKGLARESYAWGLLFRPSDREARERSGLTPGMIADLMERAKTGDFSADEMLASLAFTAQVEEDEEKKERAEERLSKALEKSEPTAVSERFFAESGVKKRNRREKPAPPKPAGLQDEPEPEPAPEVGEEPGPAAAQRKKRKKLRDPRENFGSAQRDPEKAAALAKQGQVALRAGARSKAAGLFNQAIAHDNKNASALSGLSRVYFDTGQTQKAIVYAEKAARASPANRQYRLNLGDAYYKALRYRDALEQYEKAKKLGSGKADERIARAKAKIGG